MSSRGVTSLENDFFLCPRIPNFFIDPEDEGRNGLIFFIFKNLKKKYLKIFSTKKYYHNNYKYIKIVMILLIINEYIKIFMILFLYTIVLLLKNTKK